MTGALSTPTGFGLFDDIDGDLEEIEAIAEAIERRKGEKHESQIPR